MDSDSRATGLDARLATTFGLHSFCLELAGEDCVEVQPGPGLATLLHVVTPGAGMPWPRCAPRSTPPCAGCSTHGGGGWPPATPYRWSCASRRRGPRADLGILAGHGRPPGRGRARNRPRGNRDRSGQPHEHLGRIAESLEEHLYTAQFDEDGRYSELYTGPGGDRFLGPIPDGVDPAAAWDERVIPTTSTR